MIKLSKIFDIVYGVNLELLRLEEDINGINFVSRTSKNNGVSAKVKLIVGLEPNPLNTLSIALSGTVLETFLQKEPYYSGRDLAYAKPKISLTDVEMLYYCLCIRANKFRFNYGRAANRTIGEILVPEWKDIPKWVYDKKIPDIEQYRKKALDEETPKLDVSAWKEFKYTELFKIERGTTSGFNKLDIGETPIVSSSATNNGISAYIDKKPDYPAGIITVANNGSIGEAFYQTVPFCATSDINVLFPKFKLNPYIAMFLCTIIRQEQFRYNYGYKWILERMRNSVIKLPVDKDGNPDWQFMENYIKTLPFSAELEKIKINKQVIKKKKTKKLKSL